MELLLAWHMQIHKSFFLALQVIFLYGIQKFMYTWEKKKMKKIGRKILSLPVSTFTKETVCFLPETFLNW